MNRRRRDLNPHQVRAEINVTSLVDVAFTLLVIFIITAPVLQGGIEVNLPRGDVGYIEATDKVLIVAVTASDSVFFGDMPVPREDAPSALRQLIRANELESILFKGDVLAFWGTAFSVMEATYGEGARFYVVAEDDLP